MEKHSNLPTPHITSSSSFGSAANEGCDGRHWSDGLSGRVLLKPGLVLMRRLDVATRSSGHGKDQMLAPPAQPARIAQPICATQQSIFSHWEKDRHTHCTWIIITAQLNWRLFFYCRESKEMPPSHTQ